MREVGASKRGEVAGRMVVRCELALVLAAGQEASCQAPPWTEPWTGWRPCATDSALCCDLRAQNTLCRRVIYG